MKYGEEIKEGTKNFLFGPVNKNANSDKFLEYKMPENYEPHARLYSDWSDRFG